MSEETNVSSTWHGKKGCLHNQLPRACIGFSFLGIINDMAYSYGLLEGYGAVHELMTFEKNNQELTPELVHRNSVFVSRLLSIQI